MKFSVICGKYLPELAVGGAVPAVSSAPRTPAHTDLTFSSHGKRPQEPKSTPSAVLPSTGVKRKLEDTPLPHVNKVPRGPTPQDNNNHNTNDDDMGDKARVFSNEESSRTFYDPNHAICDSSSRLGKLEHGIHSPNSSSLDATKLTDRNSNETTSPDVTLGTATNTAFRSISRLGTSENHGYSPNGRIGTSESKESSQTSSLGTSVHRDSSLHNTLGTSASSPLSNMGTAVSNESSHHNSPVKESLPQSSLGTSTTHSPYRHPQTSNHTERNNHHSECLHEEYNHSISGAKQSSMLGLLNMSIPVMGIPTPLSVPPHPHSNFPLYWDSRHPFFNPVLYLSEPPFLMMPLSAWSPHDVHSTKQTSGYAGLAGGSSYQRTSPENRHRQSASPFKRDNFSTPATSEDRQTTAHGLTHPTANAPSLQHPSPGLYPRIVEEINACKKPRSHNSTESQETASVCHQSNNFTTAQSEVNSRENQTSPPKGTVSNGKDSPGRTWSSSVDPVLYPTGTYSRSIPSQTPSPTDTAATPGVRSSPGVYRHPQDTYSPAPVAPSTTLGVRTSPANRHPQDTFSHSPTGPSCTPGPRTSPGQIHPSSPAGHSSTPGLRTSPEVLRHPRDTYPPSPTGHSSTPGPHISHPRDTFPPPLVIKQEQHDSAAGYGQLRQNQHPDATVPDDSKLTTPLTAGCDEDQTPESVYQCRWIQCASPEFASKAALIQHVNRTHVQAEDTFPSAYVCRWLGCGRKGRSFNARYKMLVHVRCHTQEKPHECYQCGKSFSRLENLKIHHRTHTGERPYLCTYAGCSKAFSNSSDRFKHQRTHIVPKPYPCRVLGCCKSYTDPSSLRKHSKTHEQRDGCGFGAGAPKVGGVGSVGGVIQGIPGIAQIPGNPCLANFKLQDNFAESRVADAAEDSTLAVSRVANERLRAAAGASRVEVESRVAEMATNAQASRVANEAHSSRVAEMTSEAQSELDFRPKEEHTQETVSRRVGTPSHQEPNDQRMMHLPKQPEFFHKLDEGHDQSLIGREESRFVSHWLTTLTQDKPLDLTTNSI